ncbi:MAG: PAS domain-containing sensor histidine kinase [Gammaproteobacteria bacterium]|nr:PAS domain-containing sensor histidine kinase [Gammaproteobacteria bacterium]
MNLKNKEYLFLAVFFLLFLVVIGFVAYVSFREHELHEGVFVELRERHELSEKKGELISDLYQNASYLGMIHNFKNVILRKDADYLNLVEENISNALAIISAYQLINLQENELAALLAVKNIVNQYQKKIVLVDELIKSGASNHQIDRQVSVDDDHALAALNSLHHIWHHEFELLESQQDEVLEELQDLSHFGAHSFPLYVLLGFGFVGFLYRYMGQLHVAEHKMTQGEGFISDIIFSSAEAIITIDGSGAIELFNPAAEKLFSYSADEVIGKDVSIIMPVDEREAHKQYVEKSDLYETRIIHKVRELQGLRKDGSCFPLELNVSRMKHHSEPHYIGVCRDITERMEIEKNRAEAQHAVELALIDAEKASQAKSQFLSSMSHELRTPLNAVIGFSQIIQMNAENNLTEDQLKNVGEIENAGNHLLQLINDVLDLSKIESGYLDLNIEPVALTDLMSQCEIIISPLLEKYRIIYDYDREKCDQIIFNTDHLRLKQVLLNLLTNACKYNKPGGKVKTHCELNNDSLRISVIDTGMGINNSEIKELFEPFNRMGAECGQIEGTGIGLNITLKLVELLGGNLGVESTLGKGSHFWIDLPLNYYPEKV